MRAARSQGSSLHGARSVGRVVGSSEGTTPHPISGRSAPHLRARSGARAQRETDSPGITARSGASGLRISADGPLNLAAGGMAGRGGRMPSRRSPIWRPPFSLPRVGFGEAQATVHAEVVPRTPPSPVVVFRTPPGWDVVVDDGATVRAAPNWRIQAPVVEVIAPVWCCGQAHALR